MAVRWTINFYTLSGVNGLVEIYDSSYSGDPIAIEPAVNAFSTTRQQQDFFQPIVPDSGYLRVIDNGIASQHIDEIHALSALDRPVAFYLGGVLKWRGYISPESFSMDWEPAPRVVEFPLVGVLNILDSVNIQVNNNSLQPIAAFIKEILAATGFSWNNVILARQMAALDSYQVFPEFRLMLSRYDFVKRNDSQNIEDPDWTAYVGDSYLTVLEKICSYFGWTASQNGTDLVLTNSRIDLLSAEFSKITWNNLSSLAADYSASITASSVTRPVLSLMSMDFDGIGHRKSIRNGYKKAVVRTDIGSENNLFPHLLFNGKKVAYYEHKQLIGNLSQGYYLNGRVRFLNPSKESVELYTYYWDSTLETWVRNAQWHAPTGETFHLTPRGDIVEATCFDSSLWAVTDPSHNYSKYLRISFKEKVDDVWHTLPDDKILAVISAAEEGFFAGDGAICFTARVKNNFFRTSAQVEPDGAIDEDGLCAEGAYTYSLRIAVKIGDKYYNGTEWVDNLTTIVVNCEPTASGIGPSDPGDGIVEDNNNGRYDNAVGYVMPITENMTGKLEIYIYPPTGYMYSEINTLFLHDFSVNYFNNFITANQNDKGVRISSLTGKAFKSDKEITLNLSSLGADQPPMPSNAYLFYDGAPIGSEEIMEYSDAEETTLAQPEYWLLNSLIKAYSKPAEWLELEMSLNDNIQLYSVITYNGKSYLVVGIDTDYDNEHIKLWIATYE